MTGHWIIEHESSGPHLEGVQKVEPVPASK